MNETARKKEINVSRRDFLCTCGRYSSLALIAGAGLYLAGREKGTPEGDMVWQLDPEKCIQCGRCATECVLAPSAVKCVHVFAACGYCNLCGGYFQPGTKELSTGAENQLCPTGAIKRLYVEDPYYEYTIDEKLCVGCAKCVSGCSSFGNGSLVLQVRHDRCLNCNECSIARVCPSGAFFRVPSSQPAKI